MTTNRDLEEIRQGFEMFDIDGTGRINTSDLLEAFEAIKINEKTPFIYDIIENLADEKDEITIDELISYIDETMSDDTSQKGVKNIFDSLSDSNNNKLYLGSLPHIAKESGDDISKEQLKYLISKADMAGDDMDFDQFSKLFKITNMNLNEKKVRKVKEKKIENNKYNKNDNKNYDESDDKYTDKNDDEKENKNDNRKENESSDKKVLYIKKTSNKNEIDKESLKNKKLKDENEEEEKSENQKEISEQENKIEYQQPQDDKMDYGEENNEEEEEEIQEKKYSTKQKPITENQSYKKIMKILKEVI